MQPIFTTPRLIIRALNENDAANIAQLRSNKIVNKFIDRPAQITLQNAQDFIQKINQSIQQNQSFYWAICTIQNNSLIGTTCLFKFSNDNTTAELGYELSPTFHGKGIITEALEQTIKWAFTNLPLLHTIHAVVQQKNIKSINVLQRQNFVLINASSILSKQEIDSGLIAYQLKK